ncbi:MHS family MFS transporter [Amycolatopsis rubida]|uniref:MHS family MFS transporter n=1 Tax=Amycolatopsis rubida TaxID=112413 RepID=A0ABX0C097_9PSEU|nr:MULTISPECIES: MFS transporter [Amycolatopsis]MYW96170.1 MFS transporter [Amycolatopsis rubida]NEC61161.1 MHS family MFS transporter [Amycolatopsis rubida]OAP24314.1 Inner membrane metabolite transport protein YhjE [Amycolatopsis sp. M39]
MEIENQKTLAPAQELIPSRQQQRKVYLASLIGSTVEFYDFAIYGTAASLVFGQVYFSAASPAVGVIASLATFATGYLARPVGGAIFGHFGDRIGRKSVLLVTLFAMGASTVLVGLLPTAGQIGALAPVLLVVLRLIQGLAVGGEWGGAVLMSIESGGQKSRGFFGSATGVGASLGVLLATGAFSALGGLDKQQFLSWGWRIPFLASIVLIAVGAYVRLSIDESPVFRAARDRQKQGVSTAPKMPLLRLLRETPLRLVLAIGVYTGPVMAQSIVKVFLVSWGVSQAGVSRQVMLNSLTLAVAGMVVTVPLFAILSDRIGRRAVYVPATVLFGAFSFVMFPMVGTGSTAMIVLAFVISMTVLEAAALGPVGAILSELFPTRTRYTGTSLAYQFAGMLGGGFGPLIAAIFVVPGGPGPIAISGMIGVFCVLSAICTVVLGDTRKADLSQA